MSSFEVPKKNYRLSLLSQRAVAAFLAIALRLRGESLAALASPPFKPPFLPAACFFGSLPSGSGVRSAAASGSSLSSRLSKTCLAKIFGSLLDLFAMPSTMHKRAWGCKNKLVFSNTGLGHYRLKH